jgi:hypothetical protein
LIGAPWNRKFKEGIIGILSGTQGAFLRTEMLAAGRSLHCPCSCGLAIQPSIGTLGGLTFWQTRWLSSGKDEPGT